MQLALGPGDKISVYKANMIIPQIAENHTKSGAIDRDGLFQGVLRRILGQHGVAHSGG